MFKTHHIPTLLLYRLIAAFVVSLLLWHLPARANDATPQPREASTLPDPVARKEFATRLQQSQRAARAHAISQAKRYNLPITITGDDGYSFFELVDWQNSRPVYYGTLNLNAAISSSANLIWPSPYLAQGANGTVGVWDAGSVRATHQEFDTRVTVKDNVANHTHSTHVAGTIAAKGFNIDAHGMAPLAKIDSYDWLDNYSEIYNAAATYSGEPGKIYISNHSYAFLCGWSRNNSNSPWVWNGSGTDNNGIETLFGRYDVHARETDDIAFQTPYHLMFWAAGNDRSDTPAQGANVQLHLPDDATTTYNSAIHPPGDSVYRGGYETISCNAVGKNIITVGAVKDAVTGGLRDLNQAGMTTFSSWGPTDDGRIKPDIVANGYALVSAASGSDASYTIISGTSMAAPNAAGTAIQLHSYYNALNNGRHMRAATLKGLLIHTADDLGTPGPDYQFGWGLINAKTAADLIAKAATNTAALTMVESSVTSGDHTQNWYFHWDRSSPIRATLSWTDPRREAIAEHDSRLPHLVNDLNLKIITPRGKQLLPYVMPFVGNWSLASMSHPATNGINHTDNVEQVYLANPTTAGRYRAVVSVSGTLIHDLQQYSLWISGSKPPPHPPTVIIIR